MVGPVALPAFDSDSVWKLPAKLKKEVFGKAGAKILVGGLPNIPGVSAEELKKLSGQTKDDIPTAPQPVFYHEWPLSLHEELVHSYQLRAIYDLCSGGPDMPMTCIRNEIPYFGLTLTESHKSMLLAKLENLV